MVKYHLAFSEEVCSPGTASPSMMADRLREAFLQISAFPNMAHDSKVIAANGDLIHRRRAGLLRLHYFVDDTVKEVRIVEITRIRRH